MCSVRVKRFQGTGTRAGSGSPSLANLSSSTSIAVNVRTASAALTGVQRYTVELCARLGSRVKAVSPGRPLHGIRGHLWEQTVLPRVVGSRLLWSPGNTGPIMVNRQVVTIHDVAVLDHPEWYRTRFATWYRWLIPRLIIRASHLITVSEFTKRRLIEIGGIPESRVSVVPNGVDPQFCPRSSEEVEQVREHLLIPSARYILSLGTLEPRKNLRRQLEAWWKCQNSIAKDIWLVIAGGNVHRHVFDAFELKEIPPRVHFAGYVPDELLPALYHGALAFLYTSIYEGFGLPVVEAMAVGTVPIAAASTALPEVVGDAGILVDPNKTDAIADAIVRTVNDPTLRYDLAQRGLVRSAAFNWNRAAEMTWAVLAEASTT